MSAAGSNAVFLSYASQDAESGWDGPYPFPNWNVSLHPSH